MGISFRDIHCSNWSVNLLSGISILRKLFSPYFHRLYNLKIIILPLFQQEELDVKLARESTSKGSVWNLIWSEYRGYCVDFAPFDAALPEIHAKRNLISGSHALGKVVRGASLRTSRMHAPVCNRDSSVVIATIRRAIGDRETSEHIRLVLYDLYRMQKALSADIAAAYERKKERENEDFPSRT